MYPFPPPFEGLYNVSIMRRRYSSATLNYYWKKKLEILENYPNMTLEFGAGSILGWDPQHQTLTYYLKIILYCIVLTGIRRRLFHLTTNYYGIALSTCKQAVRKFIWCAKI